ncbi:hypothetical protein GHT06_017188 [Daphnia sinensis]|uniref:Uncharacterized protein n=1 Tax=Daphnia sinensis TaxID=1820382 RepID=A0AAD5L8P1_9CRUS|nr:hypothetical protein GHT06_017188 [Daphnia sinensis]
MFFKLTGRPGHTHTFAKYRMDEKKKYLAKYEANSWTSVELSRQGTGSPLGLPSPN